MTTAFFQVQLSVQPKEGGEAELVLPEVLQGLNYQFVLVKDGAQEGIVKLDVSGAELKTVEQDKHCKKLSSTELESLKNKYPAPRLKQRYRPLPEPEAAEGEQSAIDDQGNQTIETLQTVRSGFYLIDVPVLSGAE
ncbi:hypothetical protein J5X98_06285 [Leptothermofonsia sichuanensis E412]|uniref:hypothetical protein n=1 Tax=Leptothermofonsia sichuanensis TaxID=2917832 RepID=UPI001CA6BD27|nr:hypothetical protein [Leptothermofonsia sichuanensis]QZZ22014.1 hypothetical protein J5X98_06285 [Leptothermofonsia sichuanensis E412]